MATDILLLVIRAPCRQSSRASNLRIGWRQINDHLVHCTESFHGDEGLMAIMCYTVTQ